MEELLKNSKILQEKKFSIGSVFLIEVNTGVLAVVAVDNNYASLCSRGFFYSEYNKK